MRIGPRQNLEGRPNYADALKSLNAKGMYFDSHCAWRQAAGAALSLAFGKPAQLVGALKRLDDQARKLERTATGPSFGGFIAKERAGSALLGGRSVFGWEAALAESTKATKP